MKVLIINGSPHAKGCTYTALCEVEQQLHQADIETEWVQLGNQPIAGCRGCYACSKLRKCVIDDPVNETAEKLTSCDGLLIGSPVYYASANGSLTAFLDRLFYCKAVDWRMKVGAAVFSARRGGIESAFDQINKYFALSNMPIAPSQYWNGVHGNTPEEVLQDTEGLQIMRALGRNMAFLVKSIALGKQAYGIPEREKWTRTNFIR